MKNQKESKPSRTESTETWKVVEEPLFRTIHALPAAEASADRENLHVLGSVKVRFRSNLLGVGPREEVLCRIAEAVIEAHKAGRKSLTW